MKDCCPTCGQPMAAEHDEEGAPAELAGVEGEEHESAEDTVLKQLLALLEQEQAGGLKKKPAVVSAEIAVAKPKKKDDEDDVGDHEFR